MRNVRSGLIVNEVTRNGWLWGALMLCAAQLAAPPYWPPRAHLLHFAPPTASTWSVTLTFSLAPLILAQATMVVLRTRSARPQ